MPEQSDTVARKPKLSPVFAAGALYDSLLQAALKQFFDRATFESEPIPSASSSGHLGIETTEDPYVLTIRWFGFRHLLRAPAHRPFTSDEVKLARAIGAVLSARYRAIFDPTLMAERGDLFRGAIEDRYVGAFLENGQYTVEKTESRADRIALAIEVLRVAALSSYENRPISSGVLLLDTLEDVRRVGVSPVTGGHTYSHTLTAIKSFYRLCDGTHTLFLVNRQGLLLDIIDITRWADACGGRALAVPCADAFKPHARSTLKGGHVCVILSPSHEIKVFAAGVQAFAFRNASWRLLDVQERYKVWVKAVGEQGLAERLFQTALDLADAREGALFVVLRNPAEALPVLIAPADRLDDGEALRHADSRPSRRDLLYLVAHRNVADLDSTVLAALGSLDGATVVDRTGRLLAAGAILLHPVDAGAARGQEVEGARTTAAMAAARFGPVLKVSEDGLISLYDGDLAWHM